VNETGTGTTDVANSTYTASSTVVDAATIKSFDVADVGTLLAGGGDAYAKSLTVTGVLENGTKVVVPENAYTVTSTNNAITYANGKLSASDAIEVDANTKQTTVPVLITTKVGANAPQTITKNVTVSKQPSAIESLSMKDAGAETKKEADGVVSAEQSIATNPLLLVQDILKATDQYGVDVQVTQTTVPTAIATNVTDGKNVGSVVPGDTYNITAISNNGKLLTFKVIVKANDAATVTPTLQ
jgi:hypothetical protein